MAEGPGPTADVLYDQWRAANRPADVVPWFAFCAADDYCTTPCTECGKEGRIAQKGWKGHDAARRVV